MRYIFICVFLIIAGCEKKDVQEELPVYSSGFFTHCESQGSKSTNTWYVFTEDATGSWYTKTIFHYDYINCSGQDKRFIESYQYTFEKRSNSLLLTKTKSTQKVFSVAEAMERNSNLYCGKYDWNIASQVNTTGLDCNGIIFEENAVEEIDAILTEDSLTIDGLVLENGL